MLHSSKWTVRPKEPIAQRSSLSAAENESSDPWEHSKIEGAKKVKLRSPDAICSFETSDPT